MINNKLTLSRRLVLQPNIKPIKKPEVKTQEPTENTTNQTPQSEVSDTSLEILANQNLSFVSLTPETKADVTREKYFSENTKYKINPKDYTPDALKKAFPEDKYKIHEISYSDGSENIFVLDLSTNKIILDCNKRNGMYYITQQVEQEIITKYNLNGYSDEGIVKEIYDQIHQKNALGLPETADGLKDFILNNVNAENISNVASQYKTKSGESLFDSVFSEVGLSAKDRADIANHLVDKYIENAQKKGVYTDDIAAKMKAEIAYQQNKIGPMNSDYLESFLEKLDTRTTQTVINGNKQNVKPANGKIDADFNQGHVGDCWLISAIKALANNPETLEMLNRMISVDANGNVVVDLKHVGKTYTICKDELEGANELSNGDMDVRAFEIAVNRYLSETNSHDLDPHSKKDIEGNTISKAMEILMGTSNINDTGVFGSIYDALFGASDSLIEKIQSGETLALCSANSLFSKDNIKCGATNDNGENVEIERNHAYAIVGADKDYVYLVNPWDKSETIKISHEEFKDIFDSVGVFELDEIREKNKPENEDKTEDSPKKPEDKPTPPSGVPGSRPKEPVNPAGSPVVPPSIPTPPPVNPNPWQNTPSQPTGNPNNGNNSGKGTNDGKTSTPSDAPHNPHRPNSSNPDALPGSNTPDNGTAPSEQPNVVLGSGHTEAPRNNVNFGDEVGSADGGSRMPTQKEIDSLVNALREKYGTDVDVNITVNEDGSIDWSVSTGTGYTGVQNNGNANNSSGNSTSGSSDGSTAPSSPNGGGTDVGGSGVNPYDYFNPDGTFDVDGFVEAAGDAGWDSWNYSGSAAQDVFGDLQGAAESGDWDSFWDNLGTPGSYGGGGSGGDSDDFGFDIFSPGGGGGAGRGTEHGVNSDKIRHDTKSYFQSAKRMAQ